jgi:hypothetical protein
LYRMALSSNKTATQTMMVQVGSCLHSQSFLTVSVSCCSYTTYRNPHSRARATFCGVCRPMQCQVWRERAHEGRTRTNGPGRNCCPARPSSSGTRMTETCTIVLSSQNNRCCTASTKFGVHSQRLQQVCINIIINVHPSPFFMGRACPVSWRPFRFPPSSGFKIHAFSLAQSTHVHPCGCCCNRCRHATTPNIMIIVPTGPRRVDADRVGTMAQSSIGNCRAPSPRAILQRSAASRSNELYVPCSTRCRRNNRCVYLWPPFFESTRRLTVSAAR